MIHHHIILKATDTMDVYGVFFVVRMVSLYIENVMFINVYSCISCLLIIVFIGCVVGLLLFVFLILLRVSNLWSAIILLLLKTVDTKGVKGWPSSSVIFFSVYIRFDGCVYRHINCLVTVIVVCVVYMIFILLLLLLLVSNL